MFVEGLLRLEASGSETARIRHIATDLLTARWKHPGAAICAEVAPLLILRHGDSRSLPRLKTVFTRQVDNQPGGVIRAAAIVYASYGEPRLGEVRKAAASLLRNPLADMVRLAERIKKYEAVPDRFGRRMKASFDPVAGRHYMDMRDLLAIRLLGLNTRPRVRQWLADKRKGLLSKDLSDYERRLITRLLP